MQDDPLEVYEPPALWTPEHVMHRLVMAYGTISRMRDRIGPKNMQSGWPTVTRDYEDALARVSAIGDESEEQRNHRLSTEIWEEWESSDPPDAHEVSLMEEAFAWPGQYLSRVLGEDRIAITRWAVARARGYEGGGIGIAMVRAEAEIISKGLARDCIPVR